MNRMFFFIAFSVLLLNSCMVSKKVVYVKDMVPDSIYKASDKPILRIQGGDRLHITVRAKNAELAAPFELDGVNYVVNEKGAVATAGTTTAAMERGYLVGEDGTIDFPVFGELVVAGLTMEGVKQLIRNRLINDNLISNPIVRVELMNLKINVMGEVAKVGVLEVPEGKINLLEAVSRAGGLSMNGAADQVMVIREENQQRKMIVANLESKELFQSEGYNLQQNDVVYVVPKGPRMTPKDEMKFRFVSLGLGIVSVVLTTLTLLKN